MKTARHQNAHWHWTIKWLHWLIALLIIEQFVSGWVAESMPSSRAKFEWFYWHKSLGMLVLFLVFTRLIARSATRRPRHEPGAAKLSTLARRAAQTAHALLYLGMLSFPLSGWLLNSAAGFPFKVFGVWRLPALVERSADIKALAEQIHLWTFWLMLTIILLHIAAALWHHFHKHDQTLNGMLPRLGKR